MKTNIGITESNLQNSASLLNKLLADEYVLYTKTRNYHWNVTGASFQELHKFFESQYEKLDEIIDDVAERVRSLGHWSLGTLKDMIKLARLNEDIQASSAADMLKNLLDDHETVIRILREDVNTVTDKYSDLGTADFLTGLMEVHEKMAWMLRAYVS